MAPKLTLYFTLPSPPARAVKFLTRLLDIDIDLKEVDLLKGEQFSEEFTKVNPVQKLPVLIDGNLVLSESRAIMGYLVSTRKPGSDLYPTDPVKRALIDERLFYDATMVFKVLALLVRPTLFDGINQVVQKQKDDVRDVLRILNIFLDGQDYFAGKNLTIADISIAASISFFAEAGYDLSQYPNLKKWYGKLQSLPGFDEFLEGAKLLADVSKKGYKNEIY